MPDPHTPIRHGSISEKPAFGRSSIDVKPPQAATPPAATPPPVIPTSWLAPYEQRRLIVWSVGLIEVMKVWDIIAPHFIDVTTNLVSPTRVQGPWSAVVWAACEAAAVGAIALLRIPGLSPSPKKFMLIVPVIVCWNLVCWFLADPMAFVPKVSMLGPVHLGEEGLFWGWLYLIRHILSRLIFGEEDHIAGVHKIRLLPYSTATLNPLSLTYCLPPGSREPIFIPIVFNNSAPEKVSYYVRSLETSTLDVVTVPSTLMKRPVAQQALQLTEDDGDDSVVQTETMAELVRRRSQQLDLARLHSVRPSESLSVIPPDLSNTEQLFFLTVTQPSIITLSSVTDRRGDRFNIAPHREALVIECPTGGDFVEEKDKGIVVPFKQGVQKRCLGDEEVLQFQARGVAPLKVSWKRTDSKGTVNEGVIEGIEDKSVIAEAEEGTFRRDRFSHTHTVPLRIGHNKPGSSAVTLTSVVDALGNTYIPSGAAATQRFQVIPRRSAAFSCPRPLELLVNGSLPIQLRVDGAVEDPVDITYLFTPADGREPIKRTEKVSGTDLSITASEAGRFNLLDIEGMCAGGIIEPSSCVVSVVPPPRAQMRVTTLHECAMDVGVTVDFEFTGTPPFVVHWTEQRQGARVELRQIRFDNPSGTLELRPDREGKYKYSFSTLSDARYKSLPLDFAPIEQVVHPPASVDITGATRQALYACDGNEVDINLAVKGNDPLLLTYRTSWGDRSSNTTVPVKSGNRESITVPIPSELAADTGAAGKVSIALVSIEDANGCVKRLTSRLVEVDINRHRPTARFGRYDSVVLREGDSVDAPIRLTGDGPWEVIYTLDGKEQPAVRITTSNGQLRLANKGTYKLVAVRDLHCGGGVDDGTWTVDYKPRPSASLATSAHIHQHANMYRHKGLCAGEEDAAAVQFVGASPFQISYKYTFDSHTSSQVLKSAQEVGVLHLASEPGHHTYRFTSVRDANYEHTPVSFTLEHDVHARPSASFVRHNSLSLCRDSALRTDAKIRLSGVAPFVLQLGVRKPASAEVKAFAVPIESHEWVVQLPDEIVSDVGRYEVSIMGISDAAGCEYLALDSDVLSTAVDVVETARVVPITHEADLCVGDTLDFLLQGKSPWIVEYQWRGSLSAVTSSSARFSRLAEQEGTFEIKSVALKDRQGRAQCKRQVDGLARHIHPLPRVRIQDGTDNLREGDQPAVFAVTFTGTPPFSFTYTRAEPHGGRMRVVETQTVTDIWEDQYAISSSAPGDYAVTSVSDKYCRYPPLSRGRVDV